jgi:hypothetical protein
MRQAIARVSAAIAALLFVHGLIIYTGYVGTGHAFDDPTEDVVMLGFAAVAWFWWDE